MWLTKDSTMRLLNTYSPILAGLLLVMGVFSSCRQMNDNLSSKPTAFGSMNALFVVADQNLWEGPVGDTIRYYFESPVPILPQPEPMFDLRHFTREELNGEQVRKELRHYLIVGNISDENSPTANLIRADINDEQLEKAQTGKKYNLLVGKDKWAKGQKLFYLFAPSEDHLFEAIANNYSTLAKKIQQSDEKQVAGLVYGAGTNRTATSKIQEQLGLHIKVPKDYYIAIEDDNTFWIRYETQDLSSNILVSKLPYRDTSQLTKRGLLKIRDSLGRAYITTAIEGAYMRTNDEDLPVFVEVIDLNGKYALEARGIWDIVGDFMGGPFVSYLVHRPGSDQLYFIDCFVHAPGKEKRDYMQQLEHVIKKSDL